ncbi:RNA-binding protein [Shewanella intestini]|uniref:RNA-binding protein n=1 Tax=Shewanella intestini TaxID=2017544 RepID=A0ABS5I7S4_9GAMM|nr:MULTISPECIES: RNA-binding protein [Shewanella]MBR9729365.1 RNA-binding protein [Shewanella intestini]MRG37444.1 RNA-binding protein [Shewanella sp. XMDDZSB0408]
MQKSLIMVLVAALAGAFVFSQFATDLVPFVAYLIGVIVTTVIFTLVPTTTSNKANEPYVGPTMTLYVGNLPYRVHEGEVKSLFGEYGPVNSVRLVRDRKTGRRKGFGFVEMSEAGAKKAMAKLNDYNFQERTLKVREAKSQENDPAEPKNVDVD